MDLNKSFMKKYLQWQSIFFSIFQLCFMKNIGYNPLY